MCAKRTKDPALSRGKTTVGLMAALLRDYLGQTDHERGDRNQFAATAAQFQRRDASRLDLQRERASKAQAASGAIARALHSEREILSALQRHCPGQLAEHNVLGAWTVLRATSVRVSRTRLGRLMSTAAQERGPQPSDSAKEVIRLLRKDAAEIEQGRAQRAHQRTLRRLKPLVGEVTGLMADGMRSLDEVLAGLQRRRIEATREDVRKAMSQVGAKI